MVSLLEQCDAVFFAFPDHVFRPYRDLDFAHMGLLQHEHADTGLSDTAADGQRQRAVDDALVERELKAFFTARFLQLFLEGLGIDRATRRRMLNQKRIIDGRSFMEVSVGNDDTTGGDASLLRADEGGTGLGTRVRLGGVIGDGGAGPVGSLIEG